MPFSLVRVDDRTIHGQVVLGWASFIAPDRIILCNDQIASSEWEKELYESSFSDSSTEINVFTRAELQQYARSEKYSKERCILLVENLQDALDLLDLNIPFKTLNIGGLHFCDGKRELTDYIFLDDDDVECLKELQSRGILIEGQDIPSAKKVNVMKLVSENL
jgi:PTS system mannose-specific IIB component